MRLAALVWACLAGVSAGAALAPGTEVGPASLETLDGRPLSLENYAERKGTVLLFLSSRSPAVDAAAEEINRIHQKFRLRDVLFVGVSSNPAESGEELRLYAQSRGMVFPIYRDFSGALAKRLGARVTPEVFLVDSTSRLLYQGSLLPRDGRGGVEPAITRLLAGQDVVTPQVEAEGTPIAEPGPKREIVDPYGFPWFVAQPVFNKIPGMPAHHCSTLAEAANGDLLCLWYGGSYESAEDQVLFLARRRSGQRAWDEPEVLVRNPGQPPGNAVIFRDGADRLWVVWGRMESSRPLRRGAGWGQCRLFSRTSSDDGHTWSEDKEWPDSLGQLPRNVPVILKNGSLILGLTGHIGGQHDDSGSFFVITNDNGATWERSGGIPGGSQPTLIERADGSLMALMRNDPRLLQSESRDGGRTWSAPVPTGIPNPNAGVAMTKLASGSVLLVFNDTERGRTPLSVARSTDDGYTWEEPLKLESNPGEYSYPCIIQTRDGLIHISYTFRRYGIMHVEMNEDWLTRTQRPN
jgi:predicted neuraminidase/peroxiredoxin